MNNINFKAYSPASLKSSKFSPLITWISLLALNSINGFVNLPLKASYPNNFSSVAGTNGKIDSTTEFTSGCYLTAAPVGVLQGSVADPKSAAVFRPSVPSFETNKKAAEIFPGMLFYFKINFHILNLNHQTHRSTIDTGIYQQIRDCHSPVFDNLSR